MLIKKPEDIKAAEITSKELYLNRRQFIASARLWRRRGESLDLTWLATPDALRADKLPNVKKGPAATHDEKLNSLKDITSYNNFYELGVDKGDPAENAKYLTTKTLDVSPSKAK